MTQITTANSLEVAQALKLEQISAAILDQALHAQGLTRLDLGYEPGDQVSYCNYEIASPIDPIGQDEMMATLATLWAAGRPTQQEIEMATGSMSTGDAKYDRILRAHAAHREPLYQPRQTCDNVQLRRIVDGVVYAQKLLTENSLQTISKLTGRTMQEVLNRVPVTVPVITRHANDLKSYTAQGLDMESAIMLRWFARHSEADENQWQAAAKMYGLDGHAILLRINEWIKTRDQS